MSHINNLMQKEFAVTNQGRSSGTPPSGVYFLNPRGISKSTEEQRANQLLNAFDVNSKLILADLLSVAGVKNFGASDSSIETANALRTVCRIIDEQLDLIQRINPDNAEMAMGYTCFAEKVITELEKEDIEQNNLAVAASNLDSFSRQIVAEFMSEPKPANKSNRSKPT